MKKIMLLLLFTGLSFAQAKITELPAKQPVGKFKAFGNNFAEITKSGDKYIFVYLDMKVDDYRSFMIPEMDFETIYTLFSSFEEGKEKIVQLENGNVLTVSYRKTFGKEFVDFVHLDKYGIAGNMKEISLKQVDKLFGKAKG